MAAGSLRLSALKMHSRKYWAKHHDGQTNPGRGASEAPATHRGGRRVTSLFAALLLMPSFLLAVPHRADAQSVTKSVERGAYYFRLKAKYSHDGQPIDFDIVVACGIRVDRYKSGDSGFIAGRYPRFFVKKTGDGHAVMQIVPIACRGETTENDMVPADFLPGAIWYDKLGDYRFGVAYISEDAFENPKSQLKFHGASVQKATRAEWEAFEKQAAKNEGMRSRYYDRPYYWAGDAKRFAEGNGDEVEAAYARGCHGYARYELSQAAREILRKYRPNNQSRYWATGSRDNGPWPELIALEKKTKIFANGLRLIEQLNHGNYEYQGFPTRAGGGTMRTRGRKIYPPELFPARFSRGLPWVFTTEVATSSYLTKDVEVRSGPGKGFFYCFTNLFPGNLDTPILEVPIPNFRDRASRIRVDGEWVITPGILKWTWPSPFFEEDRYMYLELYIGLS